MGTTEYRTVALAALLHDIGKLLHRVPERTMDHPSMSEWFVKQFADRFEDADLLAVLVKRHHESPTMNEDLQVQKIEDAHTRTLAYLVSRADNYSSGERPKELEETVGYRKTRPLDCIFSSVRLSNAETGHSGWRYRVEPLAPGRFFPCQVDELSPGELEAQVNWFSQAFGELHPPGAKARLETVYHLIEKYAWCIPSDVRTEPSDVSLFDHLRTTSALAACSYRYHMETDTLNEAAVTNDDLPRFLVVGIDLNGIQSYLYDIAETGTRAVAKRLRARSFYLSLLTEAIAWQILRQVDLPLACRLMSAGGQAFLLLPNTSEAESRLASEVQSMEQWLLARFQGELGVSFASVKLTGRDFAQGKFHEALARLKDELNVAKRTRFQRLLKQPDDYLLRVDYPHGVCAVCRKLPAHGEAEEQERICEACADDERIGRLLPRTDAVAFLDGRVDAERAVHLFDTHPLSVLLLAKADQPPRETVLYYRLRDTNLLAEVPSGFLSYNMHVPTFRDEQDLEARCAQCAERKSCEYREQIEDPQGAIKSFQCIAAASSGVQRLGYLQADVDRLGLVFALGLEGDEPQASRVSLSRLATMSRLLEYFFGWDLNELIASGPRRVQGQEVDLSEVYVTYSGGDDLLMIAPWQTAVQLGRLIAEEFARFVAHNPGITLSAGVSVVRPSCPVPTASRLSRKLLDASKGSGRNRATLFQTTLPWNEVRQAQDWAAFLTDAVRRRQEDSKRGIPRAFLYRLLTYHNMHRALRDRGQPRGALFRSRLAYDIARNFRDRDGNAYDEEVVERLEQLLQPDADNLIRMLRWPISWALLATREEDRNAGA